MDTVIFVCIVVIALCLGFFIFCYPQKSFEIQRRFYALINWRIEPISMQKEIRNTKLMGLFLIVFVLTSCIYYCLR